MGPSVIGGSVAAAPDAAAKDKLKAALEAFAKTFA